MSQLNLRAGQLSGTIGNRHFSASLRKSPADLALAPGSYTVIKSLVDPVYGPAVVLWAANLNPPSRSVTSVRLYDAMVTAIASGQASSCLVLCTRAVPNAPCLIMAQGLPDLVSALATVGAVPVTIS